MGVSGGGQATDQMLLTELSRPILACELNDLDLKVGVCGRLAIKRSLRSQGKQVRGAKDLVSDTNVPLKDGTLVSPPLANQPPAHQHTKHQRRAVLYRLTLLKAVSISAIHFFSD